MRSRGSEKPGFLSKSSVGCQNYRRNPVSWLRGRSRSRGDSETGFLIQIFGRMQKLSQKPGFLAEAKMRSRGSEKPGFLSKSSVGCKNYGRNPVSWLRLRLRSRGDSETGFLTQIFGRMQELSQKPGFLKPSILQRLKSGLIYRFLNNLLKSNDKHLLSEIAIAFYLL